MVHRIKSLHGLKGAITGTCSDNRPELVRRIRRQGGRVSANAGFTKDTEILVRGISGSWKHGSHGLKEERAMDMVRRGSQLSVVLSQDLDRLLSGRTVAECPFVAGFRVEWLRAEAIIGRLDQDLGSVDDVLRVLRRRGLLDKTTLSRTRCEQAILRRLVLGSATSAVCSICGQRYPLSLLIAGHIKPRSRCSAKEKRDLQHCAMPVCLLGCDALYERGLVTVTPNGRIVVAHPEQRTPALTVHLRSVKGRTCSVHSSETEPYFAWHREHVFMGTA